MRDDSTGSKEHHHHHHDHHYHQHYHHELLQLQQGFNDQHRVTNGWLVGWLGD